MVGEKLMEALRALDPVAYIRFASVYRSFRDIESFREELTQLLSK
jgi:transcriptional repressor NrdR